MHAPAVGLTFEVMLDVKNLKFNYDGAVEANSTLSFPDFSLARGQEKLLLGASGTGKTTLLHLIAGMLTPDVGGVMLAGEDFGAMQGAARDRFRGRHIGIVFQQAHFVQSLTVLENLQLPGLLTGETVDLAEAEALLVELGLAHKVHSAVSALSMGEQQRVSIARAVVHKPGLILADEPTSALDDGNAEAVIDLLRRQAAKAGSALLIVTHDNRLKERFDARVELVAPEKTAAK
jgi:ABC-type lipoprotein export system ATPase subunit